jgi:hypothetical protein
MKNQPASIPIGIRGFHLPLAAGKAALRKPVAIARSRPADITRPSSFPDRLLVLPSLV